MSFIQRLRKPVSIVECFCRYRYTDILLKQESRIRVSSVKFVREFADTYHSAAAFYYRSLPVFNCTTNGIGSPSVCKYYSTVLDPAKSEVNSCISPVMPEKKPFQRLPTTVQPKNYKLHFKPDLQKFTFNGNETVKVTINESINEIVLNSFELSYNKVELTDANGVVHQPTTALSVEDETLTLKFQKQLPCGEASIYFEFIGELNDKLVGFYRSKCNPAVGREEKYAAVTQFQATHARQCFPCWDEPAIKAIFDITITAPKDNVALSNMPAISEVNEPNGAKTVTFASTPIMSTYLVAMVVGDLDYVEDRSADGVLVRVYTEPGKAKQGNFALYVATKVLPYYKEYFNIAYPLPKMDLVAVADFSAGAMENWGLITYRETCLLVDTENTSSMRKQIIAVTVGHEIAHQWFGNLVTMEWWTHLWLNEGYASFVEYLCVAHLFPEYEIWTQFISQHTRALELDSLENSHPIQVPVGHPSEIDEIFDDISYSKGASIIRMLHNYIGDDDFRKGMNLYLTRHQYKNTFTEDLWAALEEASAKPVQAVMSTWTCQKGFPMVTVESVKSPHDNPNSRTFKVSQKKFYAAGNKAENSGGGQREVAPLWMVPLTYSKASDPKGKFPGTVLDKPEMTITIADVKPDEWVKFNPNTVGFYRTKYPPEILDQFLPSIQAKTMPPLDRLGLLDDLFALVQAGQASTVQVLKLIQAMTHEDNFTVWSAISDCLGKVKVLIENTDFEDAFISYGQKLFKEIAIKLGWEPKPGESHVDALLRALVLSRLGCTFKDADVIAEAKKRFEKHLSGECLIPADLRSPIYRTVMADGDEATFDRMIKLYKENDLHEEKDRIGCALGQTKKKELIKRTLEFAISDDVRTQASPIIVVYVTGSVMARELSWKFVKDNWSLFNKRYESGFLLSRLVKYTVEDFVSEERALEVEDFFRRHDHAGVERTVQQATETIRLNAAWLKRDREQMKEFFTSNN